MEFKALSYRATVIRQYYSQLEQKRYGRSWTDEEIALGFVGDVGDLAKLVMAHNGIRNIAEANSKMAHELADCLWSIMILSQCYGIDLEQTFLQTMDDLEKEILSTLQAR